MRRLLLLPLALLAGGLLGVGGAAPAGACSCVGTTDDQALASSDAVFVGVVTAHDAPLPAQAQTSADPATWTFAVSTVYKGDALDSQPLQSAASGASCGLEVSIGGEYLVFANRRGPLTADLCGGTRELAAAPVPASFGPGSAPTPVADVGPPGAGGGSSFPRAAVAVAAVLSAVLVGGVTLARARRPG